ncbi:MlaD family protein [Gordonia hydrophobica]|uniref:MlaD family protein n=1 Tax=Gordonia hydrophobica TaxID=40516 RepID=A0ABZ2U6B2_9ACTN|nr:MlaD family protein [Gordonia hydrophobica]MBM7367367.1 phospholipid/cholesterol/gamma-HCH transport system substrate-binding protein [Gordonia hydrophobica]
MTLLGKVPTFRKKKAQHDADHRLLGLGVIVVVILLLAGVFVLYIHPPGKKAITFEVTDAASIHTGEDVRIAGIVVGKVSAVTMQQDSVLIEARIDDSAFVGDQASVDVRMLTPVGGYAITIIPRGTDELTDTIPATRVTVPYSIGDVIQAAPHTTDGIETPTWHSNIKQVADALGKNDTSLRSIVDGLDSVTEVFAKQRDQVHQIAELASTYLNTFNTNKDFVFTLIKKLDSVVTSYHVNSTGFDYAYQLFSDVLYKAGPTFRTYLVNSQAYEPQIRSIMAQIRTMETELEPTINGLIGMRDKLKTSLTPGSLRQLSNGQLMLENLCIPLPGKEC